MKIFFQFCVTLLALTLILSTESCTKDSLYNVNNETIQSDTTIIYNDTTIVYADTLISSMVFISDNYSTGMPTFAAVNSLYSYSGSSYDGLTTKENVFLSSWDILPILKVRLNPSNVSLDGVEWKIIKRNAQTPSTSTKTVEGDIVFDGEFTVERSADYLAQLTFNITADNNNFFVGDGYIYAVVASYTNGAEVVSDVACYIDPSSDVLKIENLFLGAEIDGVVVDYDNYKKKITENRVIVEDPQPYATYNGETKLLSDFGIYSDQYLVELYEFSSVENALVKEDVTADAATTQWAIGPAVGGLYSAYNYNEFISEATFSYYLYTANKTFIAERSIMTLYTEMDDVNVYSQVDKDINGDEIFGDAKFTVDGYNMDEFIFCAYGNENVTFLADYTNIKCYIDDVEASSSEVSLNWTTVADGPVSYTVTVDKALSSESHTVKVVLDPTLLGKGLPIFTQTISLTLATKPVITYPTSESTYETWGNFIGDDYQLTFALSEVFKNNQDLTVAASIAGYTYKLSFASTTNIGVFDRNGVISTTIEGDFSDIESALNETQLGLGSMLTSDASRVTVKLETYFNGQYDDEVTTEVTFNNPIFIIAESYVINAAQSSTCSLKSGLTISMSESILGSKVTIYENGDFITTDPSFSPSSIIFESGTLNSKVSLSEAGLITANEALDGLSDVGNASITISVGSTDFGVKKSITPKVSVVL